MQPPGQAEGGLGALDAACAGEVEVLGEAGLQPWQRCAHKTSLHLGHQDKSLGTETKIKFHIFDALSACMGKWSHKLSTILYFFTESPHLARFLWFEENPLLGNNFHGDEEQGGAEEPLPPHCWCFLFQIFTFVSFLAPSPDHIGRPAYLISALKFFLDEDYNLLLLGEIPLLTIICVSAWGRVRRRHVEFLFASELVNFP